MLGSFEHTLRQNGCVDYYRVDCASHIVFLTDEMKATRFVGCLNQVFKRVVKQATEMNKFNAKNLILQILPKVLHEDGDTVFTFMIIISKTIEEEIMTGLEQMLSREHN